MKKMFKLVNFVAIFVMMFSLFCVDVDAGSRSSGSSSSGSSRSSSSYSKPSTSFSKPSYTPSKPSTSPSTFSKPSSATPQSNKQAIPNKTTVQPQRTPAQQAVFAKAKENGTLYTNKSQAVNDFKSKHASTYTSKYASEPTTRPSHIPQTTTINNKSVNITYNQSHGGYGYWSGGGPGLGTWMMYDMMSDAIMLNAMMSHHNYVVHDTHVTNYSEGTVSHTVHRYSTIELILCVLSIIFIIVIVIMILASVAKF